MSAAEDRFWQDCDASLARVRAMRAAVDETWDDPAVAADLDELAAKREARGDWLQAGADAYDREQERALRPGEVPF